MEICLLGTVELRAAGRSEPLGSDKARCVLASLAYETGRPVSLPTLADRLWEGRPPLQAAKSLHSYVSRIRTALRHAAGRGGTAGTGTAIGDSGRPADGRQADGGPAASVVRKAHTYTLEADRETVDLHRYQIRAAEARALADSGDDTRALSLFAEAERLWSGEPLAGLPGTWAERVRRDLAEKRKATTLVRVAVELRLGRYAEVVGDAAGLAEQYPDDETVTGRLIVALYGCGRRAEALDVYQRVVRRLRAEHGSPPGDELRRIQRAVLDRVPAAGLVPSGPAAARRRPPPPYNIPRHPPLVGRRPELGALLAVLDSARGTSVPVVTVEAIDGMAGVGKSTLAFHAALALRERFPDGQLCLDLQAHSSAEEPLSPFEALASLLRLLRVPAAEIPRDPDERTALWRTVLAHRRAVIVLDDAAGPEQVRPLLPGVSHSLVVITSRRRLAGLPGVRKLSLSVLPPDQAIALFRSIVSGERTTAGDTAEIDRVVRLCGCLPLAVEIVANRYESHPSWSVRDLRERLGRTRGRLGEIRDGSREIVRVFEFSYRALTGPQRSAFRLLGLHTGPEFGPGAAAALTGLPLGEAERVLEVLLDCHLLQEPAPHRYRFHDLLGEYARSLAVAEDGEAERDAAVCRLIDFYMRRADEADRGLCPHRSRIEVGAGRDGDGGTGADAPGGLSAARARDWFLTERANLFALVQHSWAHGRPEAAALLTHLLSGFLDEECQWSEAVGLLGRAAAHWSTSGDRYAECRSLVDLATIDIRLGRYPEAARSARRAAAVARGEHDRDGEAEALHLLGLIGWNTGELQQALLLQLEVVDIRLAAGDRRKLTRSLNNCGITLLFLTEHGTAMGCFRGALDGFLAVGDQRAAAQVTNNMGDLYLEAGDRESARRSYEEALRIAVAFGSRSDQAVMRANLAQAIQKFGEPERALVLHRETAAVFRDLGDKRNESVELNGAGTALRMTDRLDEAVTSHEHALELARSIGAAHEEAAALRGLGIAEHLLGRTDAAARHLEAALGTARRIHAQKEEAKALEGLGEVRFATGQLDESRTLLACAAGKFADWDPGEADRVRHIIGQRFAESE